MPRSIPQINGVDGSNDDLPLNTLVQLSNDNLGDETTWTWAITDQPEGAADTLSNPNIQNPTFTPKKEGSYRLRLVVDQSLTTEKTAYVIAGVRHLRSHERFPAAGELLEVDTSRGWATAEIRSMQHAMRGATDANLIACVNNAGGALGAGSIIRFPAKSTIKTGLPGQEDLPQAQFALANDATKLAGPLAVAIGAADGGSWDVGKVGIARVLGLVEVAGAGTPSVGDPVYVSDVGAASLTPGTIRRLVGRVVNVVGAVWRWVIDGGQDEEGEEFIAGNSWAPFDNGGGLPALNQNAEWHGFAGGSVLACPKLPVGAEIVSVAFRYNRGGAGSPTFDADSLADASTNTGLSYHDLDVASNGWRWWETGALNYVVKTGDRISLMFTGTNAANLFAGAAVRWRRRP